MLRSGNAANGEWEWVIKFEILDVSDIARAF